MFAGLARFFSNINLSARAEPFAPQASEESSTIPSDVPLEANECVACTESTPLHNLYIAPCSHGYCTACAVKMFEDSVSDDTLYPPRCCQQDLDLEPFRWFLGDIFVTRFMTKAIEIATTNRTYCHVATCSKFILPCDVVDNNGVCTCLSWTCMRCKQAEHDGDCAAASHSAVLALAQAQGWQSCPRCYAIIELTEGCNHIT